MRKAAIMAGLFLSAGAVWASVAAPPPFSGNLIPRFVAPVPEKAVPLPAGRISRLEALIDAHVLVSSQA